MTGRDLAERLSGQGIDAAEIPAKASLFDAALAAFVSMASGPPTHVWWVPGRLEVFGKHTDYAGGRTLVAAVPRGFLFLAGPRRDREIHVHDAESAESMVIGQRPGSFTGWRHYVEVVARRLARNFPASPSASAGGVGGWSRHGATIVFASDLPRASGMSSSSALLVGVATALTTLWHLRERDEWRASIQSPQDVAGYYACLENGLTFNRLPGDSGVGTHGGSEDHTAMLLARAGEMSAYAFVPVRHLADVALPAAWSFVIASSGVAAAKTGSARDAYNRLADGIAVLLRLWNHQYAPRESLASALASAPSAPDLVREQLSRASVPGWTPEALAARLDQFILEDSIVASATEAFRREDAAALGTLSAASQEAAERLLGNQVPHTTALARQARDSGAFASSSFGAGFGGSAWALVAAGEAEAFARHWLDVYRRAFPDRANAETFVARPGPPLTWLG
jgi:galactokinase